MQMPLPRAALGEPPVRLRRTEDPGSPKSRFPLAPARTQFDYRATPVFTEGVLPCLTNNATSASQRYCDESMDATFCSPGRTSESQEWSPAATSWRVCRARQLSVQCWVCIAVA